jgi:hypothetical protein
MGYVAAFSALWGIRRAGSLRKSRTSSTFQEGVLTLEWCGYFPGLGGGPETAGRFGRKRTGVRVVQVLETVSWRVESTRVRNVGTSAGVGKSVDCHATLSCRLV